MAQDDFIEFENGGEFKYGNEQQIEDAKKKKEAALSQWWLQYMAAVTGQKVDESFTNSSPSGLEIRTRDGSTFMFHQEKVESGLKDKISYRPRAGSQFTQEAAEDMIIAGVQSGWKDINISKGSEENKAKLWFAAQKLTLQAREQYLAQGGDAAEFIPPYSISGFAPAEDSAEMVEIKRISDAIDKIYMKPLYDDAEGLKDQASREPQVGAPVEAEAFETLGKGKDTPRFRDRAFSIGKSFAAGALTTIGAKVLLTSVVTAAFGAPIAAIFVPLAFSAYAGYKIASAVPGVRARINNSQEKHMGKGIGRAKAFMLAMKENAFYSGMLVAGAVLTTVSATGMMPNVTGYVGDKIEAIGGKIAEYNPFATDTAPVDTATHNNGTAQHSADSQNHKPEEVKHDAVVDKPVIVPLTASQHVMADRMFDSRLQYIATTDINNLDPDMAQFHEQAREVYLAEQAFKEDILDDYNEKAEALRVANNEYSARYVENLNVLGDETAARNITPHADLDEAQADFDEVKVPFDQAVSEIEKMKMRMVLDGFPSAETLYRDAAGMNPNPELSEQLQAEKFQLAIETRNANLFDTKMSELAASDSGNMTPEMRDLKDMAQDYVDEQKELARLEHWLHHTHETYNPYRFSSLSDSMAQAMEKQHFAEIDRYLDRIDAQKETLAEMRAELIKAGAPSGADLADDLEQQPAKKAPTLLYI